MKVPPRPDKNILPPGVRGRLVRNPPRRWICVLVVSTCGFVHGCGGGSSGSAPPPPPPQSAIAVSITPGATSVLLGNRVVFSATVTNATNTGVTWSVNGVAGGSTATGTISSNGEFTAPADLPPSQVVQVTATSLADPAKSASAQVTISSDVGISLTPGKSSAELDATVPFHAQITSGGHPDASVSWTLSGTSCPGACGSVNADGMYTAPQILPPSANLTVTAQSNADPSKKAASSVQISSSFTLQLAAPKSVSAGGSVTLVATLVPVQGSNPSPMVTWALSGAGCSGNQCGVLTTRTQASDSSAIPDTADYTAPAMIPNPNTVTVTVTPQADPSKQTQATVAIQAGPSISLIPGAATLATNHRVTLTARTSGVSSTALAWSVNGLPGGDPTIGQICVAGPNPCQTITSGSALQVDYLAPGTIPAPNPLTVRASSQTDPSVMASAQITVINHVLVSVQPSSVTLAPGAVQSFTASVLGSANQSVVWQVQGAGCAVSGACGTVDANGIYVAPSSTPNPNVLRVVATSSDDPAQSGSAGVTIASGLNIQGLHPASVYAGAANGLTLRVDGSGFLPSSPGSGSTLLVAGSARTTACTTPTECSVPVSAADVSVPGNVTVQIQNPDGSQSNAALLVVAPPNASDGTVQLASGAPEVDGVDITVVDPTTAGVSVPGSSVDLNIGALGTFSAATNTCTLAGNPIAIAPPATGTTAVDVCVFSQSGLDTSMTYTVSGPGDIPVVAKQPAGLGIIHLTLQVAAGAQTGARTLFIHNTNLDKTAASGALEVQ